MFRATMIINHDVNGLRLLQAIFHVSIIVMRHAELDRFSLTFLHRVHGMGNARSMCPSSRSRLDKEVSLRY